MQTRIVCVRTAILGQIERGFLCVLLTQCMHRKVYDLYFGMRACACIYDERARTLVRNGFHRSHSQNRFLSFIHSFTSGKQGNDALVFSQKGVDSMTSIFLVNVRVPQSCVAVEKYFTRFKGLSHLQICQLVSVMHGMKV